MFDLEHAIDNWKAPFLRRHFYSSVEIDELEWHLRDAVEDEIDSGRSREDAFTVAVRRVGNERDLRGQFQRNWKNMNPMMRYWVSMRSEFRGWSTRRALIGYGIARVLSLVAGLLWSIYLYAFVVFLTRGVALWLPGRTLEHQGILFMGVLGLSSAFNLLPFTQWGNRWWDWVRLVYSTVILVFIFMIIMNAIASISRMESFGMTIWFSMLAIGPILWLKQIFRLRDHQPDLDRLVASG